MATAAPVTPENFLIGRVFSTMFEAIGRNAALYFGLALLIAGLPQAVFQYVVLQAMTMAPLTGDPDAVAADLTGRLGLFGLGWLVILCFSALLSTSLTRATIEDLSGRRPQFGECLSIAVSLLIPAICIGLLTAIGAALGMILLIVPGIILWLGWCVAVPVLVQERLGVFGSMGRSWALTRGSRWALFGLFLMIVILLWLAQIAFGLIGALGVATGNPQLILSITTGISSAVGAVLMTTGAAAAYIELKRVKEGTSVDELAQIFA